MRKTDKAVSFLRQGKFKEALSIIVHFRIGFTKEEKRTLQIANDSLNGHSSFYESIGVDSNLCICKAKEIVRNKYNI